MLVLTRKTEQKIQIGDSITITILRIKGSAVRVGIEAPENVRILRSELPPRDARADSFLYESAEERPAASPLPTVKSDPVQTPMTRRGLCDKVSHRRRFLMPPTAPSADSQRDRNPKQSSELLSRRSPVARSTPGFLSPERLGPAVHSVAVE